MTPPPLLGCVQSLIGGIKINFSFMCNSLLYGHVYEHKRKRRLRNTLPFSSFHLVTAKRSAFLIQVFKSLLKLLRLTTAKYEEHFQSMIAQKGLSTANAINNVYTCFLQQPPFSVFPLNLANAPHLKINLHPRTRQWLCFRCANLVWMHGEGIFLVSKTLHGFAS